jgi:hypothetical protein
VEWIGNNGPLLALVFIAAIAGRELVRIRELLTEMNATVGEIRRRVAPEEWED